MEMSKPLSGIKVLDLTTYVAAPVCGRLLADLGADVIKVERQEGDAWRITGKSYIRDRFSDEENPIFDIYNTGKRHIVLNLKSPEGMEAFHKLLAQADVFITNNRPAALKRLGISYEDLKDRYPTLIYAIVLGYGEEGPEATKPAFDTTAYWARTGFLRDLTLPGEHYSPVVPPSSIGDTVSGMFLMGEICAALLGRAKTGKGDYVRSGLYHNGNFTMGTMTIQTQRPLGNTYPRPREEHSLPGGFYQCADGEWIYIPVAYAATLIPKLCTAIGRPDLIDDPRYNTPEKRKENRFQYYAIFRDALGAQPSSHWIDIATDMDFPLVRLAHFADVSEDEQAWANGYLEHVEFANGNVDVMPSSPIEMDSVGELKTTPAHAIGQDTRQVLAELGYSETQIEAMLRAGAAATNA